MSDRARTRPSDLTLAAQTFRSDGAVALRGVVDGKNLEPLAEGAERQSVAVIRSDRRSRDRLLPQGRAAWWV